MTVKKITLPKTLAAVNDLVGQLRTERTRLEQEAKAVGEQEAVVLEHLSKMLRKEGLPGVSSAAGRSTFVDQVTYTADDIDKLRAYIVRRKAWDLLHNRLSSTAITARLKAGETVPGVTSREFSTLRFTPTPSARASSSPAKEKATTAKSRG